jgi:hypothetical protein
MRRHAIGAPRSAAMWGIRDWTPRSFSASGRPPTEAGSRGRPACSPTEIATPGSLLQRTATTTVSLTAQEGSPGAAPPPPHARHQRGKVGHPPAPASTPSTTSPRDLRRADPAASAARRGRRRGPPRAARGPPPRARCRRSACSAPPPSFGDEPYPLQCGHNFIPSGMRPELDSSHAVQCLSLSFGDAFTVHAPVTGVAVFQADCSVRSGGGHELESALLDPGSSKLRTTCCPLSSSRGRSGRARRPRSPLSTSFPARRRGASAVDLSREVEGRAGTDAVACCHWSRASIVPLVDPQDRVLGGRRRRDRDRADRTSVVDVVWRRRGAVAAHEKRFLGCGPRQRTVRRRTPACPRRRDAELLAGASRSGVGWFRVAA